MAKLHMIMLFKSMYAVIPFGLNESQLRYVFSFDKGLKQRETSQNSCLIQCLLIVCLFLSMGLVELKLEFNLK